MSANRFFIPTSDFDGEQVRLSREQAHQVSHVLRLKTGDTITVLDGTGQEYDVTLTAVSSTEAVGRIAGQRRAAGEPVVELTLFQSLLAREKFEWVLQKATEVGVAQVVPVLTERSLVRVKRMEAGKLDRWRRIVAEAAEQSQRGCIPRLEQVRTFPEAMVQLPDFDRCLIAAPFQEAAALRDTLRGLGGTEASIALLIGPEGGFTPEEVALAWERGAVPISLGRRVLRTETAAVVAAALVLYELGEMGPGGDLKFEI
jgi:16S rRNA (uracil1498-N3)-methyltransferase